MKGKVRRDETGLGVSCGAMKSGNSGGVRADCDGVMRDEWRCDCRATEGQEAG